jgi:Ca2+-binding EF-hand superfamily protein
MKSSIVAGLVAISLAATSPIASASLPGMDQLADLIIKEFDLNADGYLDQEEWESGVSKEFAEIDTNADGRITISEIDDLVNPLREEIGETAAKVVVALIKPLMMTLDKNGDRIISKEEYLDGCNAIFKKLDANHDGRISRAELEDLPLRLLQ